ncbi:hypothetical protein Q4Q39_19680 [Flavivirga amylovorans]|uniref:Uncharacterized protein n=1 Tax=Flavivirga amylovorans TaxID=870486 RepID=A0ABT8X6W6_9FLAO|nr:hypothetical protein [Flavivirga amylovorans]MDO5989630.1 hypothetical protein [Flavivirga amylovorans]
MTKTEAFKYPDCLILPQYSIIAVLMVLIDKSHLTHAVKKHCKTGLKVIGIIYADTNYNTGTNLLSRKEFDAFFSLCPIAYFNNRELIPANTIIENIELCVRTNDVANMV